MSTVALGAARRATAVKRAPISLKCKFSSGSTQLEIRDRLYDSKILRLPNSRRPVSLMNKGLELRARDGNLTGAINLWNTMIEKETRPDETSYLILLKLLARSRLFNDSVKVFNDMVESGVGDKLAALNLVLLAATENTAQMEEALKMYPQFGLSPDATTYQYRLQVLSRDGNLERAIELLDGMYSEQVLPNKECVRIVVLLAAKLNMPVLAMELAMNANDIVGSMDDQANMAVLMSGAATLNAEATQWAWRLVSRAKIAPTEPLCVEILNLANRHGLPDLALSVLSCLVSEHVPIQEHHLAPLIGSYCAADQIKKAFKALDMFHDHGVEILPESTSALVAAIGQSTETLDNAYETLMRLPRPVNIDAINATLQAAAVTLSDLPHAIGIYKDLARFESAPTTQTFNILLAGCLKAQHRELGERLYADMLALALQPDSHTYSRLILLSLTGTEYENAFVRLEEMKERQMTPPLRVYEALVRRLVKEGDPRADLALEDMEHCGYRVSGALRKFLLSGQEEEGWRGDTAGESGQEEGRQYRGNNRRGNGRDYGREREDYGSGSRPMNASN